MLLTRYNTPTIQILIAKERNVYVHCLGKAQRNNLMSMDEK